MKKHSYYTDISIDFPPQKKYTTSYFYCEGRLIATKVWGKDDKNFVVPPNSVEEKIFDKDSYEAHMKLYQQENKRLQDEFRTDLIAKYNLSEHPMANKIFNKSWDLGCSLGYEAIEEYFRDIIELFDENNSTSHNLNFFEWMTA